MDILEHLSLVMILPERDANILLDYLTAHEREIRMDINDFGDLLPLLRWLPKPKDQPIGGISLDAKV